MFTKNRHKSVQSQGCTTATNCANFTNYALPLSDDLRLPRVLFLLGEGLLTALEFADGPFLLGEAS